MSETEAPIQATYAPHPVPIEKITMQTAKTVAELMDFEEAFPSRTTWAFRGQPRDYGKLTPSFQRVFPPASQSFGAAELIEQELINAFRKHYTGMKDLSADMPAPAVIDEGHDLRCLSVMQHYEVPTRLLDWTSDFWTAVYFACSSDPDSNAELWIYDRQIFGPQTASRSDLQSLLYRGPAPPEPHLLRQRYQPLLAELDPGLTPRMRQQAAHHTFSTDIFADHAPLLHELASQFKADPPNRLVFGRLEIAASCKGKALQFLAEHKNVSASTVFPDFAGLGRFLRWQLDSLRTMLL